MSHNQDEKEPDVAVITDAVPIDTPNTATATALGTGQPQQNEPYDGAIYHANANESLKKRYEKSTSISLLYLRTGFHTMTGRWIVPKDIYFFKICRGNRLDFTKAEFVHDTCTIHVYSICGGIYLLLPTGGIRITYGSCHICGGASGGEQNDPLTDATMMMPTIHITGFTVCGGVSVDINKIVRPIIIKDA